MFRSGIHFSPEDGGGMHLRNVGTHVKIRTALQLRDHRGQRRRRENLVCWQLFDFPRLMYANSRHFNTAIIVDFLLRNVFGNTTDAEERSEKCGTGPNRYKSSGRSWLPTASCQLELSHDKRRGLASLYDQRLWRLLDFLVFYLVHWGRHLYEYSGLYCLRDSDVWGQTFCRSGGSICSSVGRSFLWRIRFIKCQKLTYHAFQHDCFQKLYFAFMLIYVLICFCKNWLLCGL
jgi:hypothetical protein